MPSFWVKKAASSDGRLSLCPVAQQSVIYCVRLGLADSYVVYDKSLPHFCLAVAQAWLRHCRLSTLDCGMWVTLWAISTHELRGVERGLGRREELGWTNAAAVGKQRETHLLPHNHDRALTNSVDLL